MLDDITAMSSQEKYNTLRQTYPTFVYESYQYDVQPDGLHIVFSFRLDNAVCFHPSTFIPSRPFLLFNHPREVLDNLVFHVGMIELVSYWKCACPPVVEVHCGSLDDTQIQFWTKLYWHGLGEFFYVNGIHNAIDDFMSLTSTGSPSLHIASPASGPSSNNYIVPIGGGKDSVVTLELLSELKGTSLRPLIMNPRGATIGCIQAAGYSLDDVIVIHRTIDPLLLELNARKTSHGESVFLNGHTPFSAMLAFYTLLSAQLSGIPNIALSNESSANESTVLNSDVNHQYSKSLEFENDFRAYVASYIPSYNYFSFLRPLSELQIAMLFGRYEQYFDVFRSCNVGSKRDIWCCHCAKCLFAYIILSPFIPPQRLNAIFGANLLDDLSLQLEFNQLVGMEATKPFECVGTVSEVRSALSMTLARWYADGNPPALLKGFPLQPPTTPLHTLLPDHNLPPQVFDILLSHVQRVTA